ncbi:hypothetical protein CMI37_39325 [Candidatus Pacearchaeota archaeon]|nr:hypothetical protein [Candidatus Pacearchaeota archaeon]|tara:strand:+ start:6478 stop:6729 length:252 start_codon:yes stop_codon:yes gene_type:complete
MKRIHPNVELPNWLKPDHLKSYEDRRFDIIKSTKDTTLAVLEYRYEKLWRIIEELGVKDKVEKLWDKIDEVKDERTKGRTTKT